MADFELEDDSLSSLEQRIVRAVELVQSLREENSELRKQLDGVDEDRERTARELAEAKLMATKAQQELDSLRSERKQVRTRIEKLLGQMDLLSANQ